MYVAFAYVFLRFLQKVVNQSVGSGADSVVRLAHHHFCIDVVLYAGALGGSSGLCYVCALLPVCLPMCVAVMDLGMDRCCSEKCHSQWQYYFFEIYHQY